MKCIIYVSKVVARKNGAHIPTGLAQIVNVSRAFNREHGITGTLAYRNGHYLQILEGVEAQVDSLFEKIQADPRHQDVAQLFNAPIHERSFPDWGFKLIEPVGKDANFLHFIEAHSAVISALDNQQLELLRVFYNVKGSTSDFTQSYYGKQLHLTSWPDFTQIDPSPELIELCAILTNKHVAYSYLMQIEIFSTQNQLDNALRRFESLDILSIDRAEDNPPLLHHTHSSSSFYFKMKRLLGLH